MRPAVGSSSPVSSRTRVVLPVPLSPVRRMRSPLRISSESGSQPQRAAGRIFEIQAVDPDQQFAFVKLRVVEIYLQLALRPLPAAQFVQPLPAAVDQLRMFPDELRLGPFAAVLHRPGAGCAEAGPCAVRPDASAAPVARGPPAPFCGPAAGPPFAIDLLGQRLLLDPFAFSVKIIVAAVDFQPLRREFAGRAEQVEQRDVVAHRRRSSHGWHGSRS